MNGQFARYADDVVNITYNYEDALRVENTFFEHCRRSGIQLNVKKSKGISVLSEVGQELRNSENFNYLGYKMYKDNLAMSDKAILNIKQKISDRIHIYLHRHLRSKTLGYNSSRAGIGYDWDLIGCISEIRNIIYGGLKEDKIEKFLNEGTRPTNGKIKGYMSFYCLINNGDKFKELDGWLINTLFLAYKKRCRMLQKRGYKQPIIPKDKLISGNWYIPQKSRNGNGHFTPETRLPSFLRGWRAARKFYYVFGLEEISKPNYIGYSYLS